MVNACRIQPQKTDGRGQTKETIFFFKKLFGKKDKTYSSSENVETWDAATQVSQVSSESGDASTQGSPQSSSSPSHPQEGNYAYPQGYHEGTSSIFPFPQGSYPLEGTSSYP